jgi:hypothetical protein
VAFKFSFLVVLLMVVAGSDRTATAQAANFTCPKEGTVEVRGVYKVQYLGPSGTDPYVCNSLDAWGKKKALLFNYFLVNDANKSPAARDGLIALLSGSKTSVTFDNTNVATGYGFHGTWTFLRRETLTVGSKTFNTMVFERKSRRIGTSWEGEYLLWLDPRSGLWLKSVFRFIDGISSGQPYANYEDVSISLPP